jgi:hypothetical protein
MNERGAFTGHQTKPVQERRSQVSIEAIGVDEARVQGTYDVVVPGAFWRQRPAFGDDFEREIEVAIRGVLEKYAGE